MPVDLTQIPAWLGAGLLGAVIAALAYVGKAIFEQIEAIFAERRRRRAALIQLHSLLRAARVAFVIQQKNVKALCAMLQGHLPWADDQGYEQFMSRAYPGMNEAERDLHGIIRAITMHTMNPLNQAMLAWISGDTYFKSRQGSGLFGQLARQLALLEPHLLLWRAKYEAWIPEHPEHALIYLADESEHGLGFPHQIDVVLERIFPASTGHAQSAAG